MFASFKTNTVEIPDGDATVTVTITALNWKRLREAADVQSSAAMALAAKAPAEMMKTWGDAATAKAQAEEKSGVTVERDDPSARYKLYDRETVLLRGIREWTAKLAVSKESIEDLDEPAADTLHRAILDLSLGPATKEQAKAVRGED